MKKKTIIVGVTGGIAAYKTAQLVSSLAQLGYRVKVAMTEAATRFVAPLTFQTLSHQAVVVDMFAAHKDMNVTHVTYGQEADLIIIAPATANVIAKLALGLADDMITATVLASRSPVLVAPAMNTNMYLNPAVQQNLVLLKQRGFHIIEPDSGHLACGDEGPGRLAALEDIIALARGLLAPAVDLAGWKVVVTAGPTREPLDPVRYLSNRSSGRMGYALAAVAARSGARVALVSGPTSLTVPPGVERISVMTAEDMYQATKERFFQATALVMAAAVADFRPQAYRDEKIKKENCGDFVLQLEPTVDILSAIAPLKKPGQLTIGFAAESSQLTRRALKKLKQKQLDFIVANDITRANAGFEAKTNEVTIFWPDGNEECLPLASKEDIALGIWKRAKDRREELLVSTKG
ncbi:MAG TPA: bifunctional phosphopantothenoylcysteine decarboxylase/phosphopantothenate--cysteine ligase CoaBC [bacterium]|jgi:phosphopantothenoylcysteine decarboxylase/phosphopantothenate--cysteine ligase|nr:bifunctional phosphopantothenoylcysteine decarboxylase/phosphopantothenate--cysteine ligase CoaBC [bacterium]